MKYAAGYLALAAVLALTGCRICQNPWDYCNSVIGGNGSPNCDYNARANSAFHPMDGTPPTSPVGPTAAKPALQRPAGAPEESGGVDDAIPAEPEIER